MCPISGDELVRALHQAALVGGTMLDQAPDVPAGQPFAEEWQTFKREAPRLVSEGHAGRFALIVGAEVDSVWDTRRDAEQAGKSLLGEKVFLVQEVQLFVRPQRWASAAT
jgi:hypothetical protein